MAKRSDDAERGAEFLHRIGEAARMLGISRETLRIWERKGLIHAQRSPGGYRLYTRSELRRAAKMLSLRKQGINLAGIDTLLSHPSPAREERPEGGPAESAKLGRRLRQLRISGGLSLADVAERSGLSQSFLSLVERDLASPSLQSLKAVCEGLGIGTQALLAGTEHVERRCVRAKARRRLPSLDAGVRIEQLAGIDGVLDCEVMRMAPGKASRETYTHPGWEFIYVLTGKLEVEVDFQSFVLAPGDTLCFESSHPHAWRVPGPRSVAAIWINAFPRAALTSG